MTFVFGGLALPSVSAARGPLRTRQYGRGKCVAARAFEKPKAQANAGGSKTDLGCPDSETGICEVNEQKKRKVNGSSRKVDPTRSQSELGCPDSETGMCDVDST